MKGYCIYARGYEPGWCMCYGVLENGFCFASHLCSHPGFALGDLYADRPERKKILAQMFPGETFEWETLPEDEVPPEVLARNKDNKIQDEFSAKYKELSGKDKLPQPEVTIEVSA